MAQGTNLGEEGSLIQAFYSEIILEKILHFNFLTFLTPNITL